MIPLPAKQSSACPGQTQTTNYRTVPGTTVPDFQVCWVLHGSTPARTGAAIIDRLIEDAPADAGRIGVQTACRTRSDQVRISWARN
jgi:hypothetical protein